MITTMRLRLKSVTIGINTSRTGVAALPLRSRKILTSRELSSGAGGGTKGLVSAVSGVIASCTASWETAVESLIEASAPDKETKAIRSAESIIDMRVIIAGNLQYRQMAGKDVKEAVWLLLIWWYMGEADPG